MSVVKAPERKGLGRLVKELTDPKNSRFQTQVAVMLLVFEALLLAVIIARVPCMSLYLAIKRRQTPSNAVKRSSPTLPRPNPSLPTDIFLCLTPQ